METMSVVHRRRSDWFGVNGGLRLREKKGRSWLFFRLTMGGENGDLRVYGVFTVFQGLGYRRRDCEAMINGERKGGEWVV
ncbi:hypothetical protein HAX54_036866, partial [Datura stramonium]|nr:hypothetical protein [Datura stramonium]